MITAHLQSKSLFLPIANCKHKDDLMATRRSQEPKSYFKILIDGVRITNFLKVEGLSSTIMIDEQIDPQTKSVIKNPGSSQCNNVILHKTKTREQTFWNWMQKIKEGELEKKTISIELVYKNKPLRGWKLINCWPCRWSISDFTDSDILDTVEKIELAVEKIELL